MDYSELESRTAWLSKPISLGDGTWLVVNAPQPLSEKDASQISWIKPLAVPDLHRRFADIEVDDVEHGVVQFANEFGFLGIQERLASEDAPSPVFNVQGENEDRWQEEALKVRTLVGIHDAASGRGDFRCEDFIRVHPDSGIAEVRSDHPYVREDIKPSYIAAATQPAPSVGGSPYPVAGVKVVEANINRALEGRIVPHIELSDGGGYGMLPTDLLGAIYLVFAQEAMGRVREPKRCGHCHRFFVPTHGLDKYCNGKCKTYAYLEGRAKKQGN